MRAAFVSQVLFNSVEKTRVRKTGRLLLTCVFFAAPCLLPFAGLAQTPPAGSAAGGPIVPHEVLPDRRVIFRLNSPKASQVSLNFQAWNPKPQPMTKDEKGIWTITVGPVEPEIYSYTFLVDGVRTPDPLNTLDMNGTQLSPTQFEVHGNPPRFDELRDVPHGSTNIHYYASTAQGRQRAMYIYVPPQYYAETTRKFPVLYLWHGGGGVESDWNRMGRTAIILDNLIADKKALPMLVVMPSNNVLIPVEGGNVGSSKVLEKELFDDIIPFVDKHYRALTGRNNRAIAGLSAGGGTTMNVGMRRLDMFAYLGEFSTGLFGGTGGAPVVGQEAGEGGGQAAQPGGTGYGNYDPDKIAPGMYQNLASPEKKLKVFWMSVGAEDPRLPFQKQALADFQKHGIQPIFKTYAGAHEWKVWRHSLAEFAPLLFR
jgi:enterochelin esterase family protein